MLSAVEQVPGSTVPRFLPRGWETQRVLVARPALAHRLRSRKAQRPLAQIVATRWHWAQQNHGVSPEQRYAWERLIIVAAVARNRLQIIQQRALLGEKLHVAAFWANQHGMGPTDAVGQKGEAGRPVIGKLGVTSQTGNAGLFFHGKNTRGQILRCGWLGFHSNSFNP